MRSPPRVALPLVAIVFFATLATAVACSRGEPAIVLLVGGFGLGFAIGAVLMPRERGPLAPMFLGSVLGGLFAGLAIALAWGPGDRHGVSIMMPFAMPIACGLFAPLVALPFAPVLVAATRARRAPTHDGIALVLGVAGLWIALLGAVVALVAGAVGPALLIAIGLVAYAVGATWRANLESELRRVRAGEMADLSIVDGDAIAGVEGAESALPLLAGPAPSRTAWIVRAAPANAYREAPARVAIARVDAAPSEGASFLPAAFAGTRPSLAAIIGLGAWTTILLVLLEYSMFHGHPGR